MPSVASADAVSVETLVATAVVETNAVLETVAACSVMVADCLVTVALLVVLPRTVTNVETKVATDVAVKALCWAAFLTCSVAVQLQPDVEIRVMVTLV